MFLEQHMHDMYAPIFYVHCDYNVVICMKHEFLLALFFGNHLHYAGVFMADIVAMRRVVVYN